MELNFYVYVRFYNNNNNAHLLNIPCESNSVVNIHHKLKSKQASLVPEWSENTFNYLNNFFLMIYLLFNYKVFMLIINFRIWLMF